MLRSLAIIGCVLCLPAAAHADTLNDVLAQAYQNAPELQASRAQVKAINQNYAIARSGYLPSLSARGSVGQSSTDVSGTTTNLTPKSASVTLNQNLFRGGRTRAEVARAEAEINSAKAQLKDTEQRVLLSTISAYMNVIRDYKTYDIRRNNVKTLNRQLEAAEIRFDVGEITRTDVAQAQARQARAKAALAGAEAQLATSRAEFQALVGTAPGDLSPVTFAHDLPADADAATRIAEQLNPTYMAALANEKAARKTINVARAAGLPTLGLEATANTSRDSFNVGSEVDSTSITATLSVPLYTGGAARAAYRAALHQRDRARFTTNQVRRAVQQLVVSSWNQYLAAQVALNASRAQLNASEFAFDGVEQEAQVGLRTTLDVLDAEQELLEAKLAVVSANRDWIVAQYQVLSAMGQLTANHLNLDVETGNLEQVLRDERSILTWP